MYVMASLASFGVEPGSDRLVLRARRLKESDYLAAKVMRETEPEELVRRRTPLGVVLRERTRGFT